MYTTSTTTFLTTLVLLTSAMAQETHSMLAWSQISDGQIQGSPATPLPVVQTTSSSVPYENPFTIYTSQTNSLGVITGMPAVATSIPSQPAVVTSQPVSPTLPHYSGFVYGSTSSSVAVASTLSTSVVGSSSAGSSSMGTTTASATVALSTGGAAMNRVAGAGVALVVLGLGFSLL